MSGLLSSCPASAVQNLFDALSKFIRELKAGGPVKSQPVEEPQAKGPTADAPPEASTAASAAPVATLDKNGSTQKGQKAKGRSKGKLRMEERFYGSPRDLYECFTNPGKIQAFTQSPATVSGGDMVPKICCTFVNVVNMPTARLEVAICRCCCNSNAL